MTRLLDDLIQQSNNNCEKLAFKMLQEFNNFVPKGMEVFVTKHFYGDNPVLPKSEITVGMVDKVKVKLIKEIFEESHFELGMTAWLTAVEWDFKHECYKLYFDMEDFEKENSSYMQELWYCDSLRNETGRELFTSKEAGMYRHKETLWFSCGNDVVTRDDEKFKEEILNYLRVLD